MKDDNLSLLQLLSIQQIEDLIHEEELKENGYTFNYFIDQDDLQKYCFPYGIKGQNFPNENIEKTIEIDTDMLTAYFDFFDTLDENKLIFLLDEYLSEVINVKKTIIRLKNEQETLFNYADNFQHYLNKKNEEFPDEINHSYIQNDFTIFIAIASGLIYDGLERFNGIITNSFFIVTFDDFEKQTIFHPNKKSLIEAFRFSTSEFEGITNQVIKVYKANHAYRPSKSIDAKAIARMSLINQRLSKSNEKSLVLFLSSSSTTDMIFENFDKSLLAKINNRKFNFHRNVQQLFISSLIKDLEPSEKKKQLEKLKRLVELRKIHEDIIPDRIEDVEFQLIRKDFIEYINSLREQYVNLNYARQFENIKSLFNRLEKNNSNYNKLKTLFNDLKKEHIKINLQKNITLLYDVLDNSLINQKFIIIYEKAFKFLKESGGNFFISRGLDCITGTGQHLPIIFKSIHIIGDKVALLVIKNIFLAEEDSNLHEQLGIKSELIEIVSNLLRQRHEERTFQDNLSLCLISLILPNVDDLEETNAEIVYAYLEKIYQDLHISEIENDEDLYSDFLYLLASVARRLKKYSFSLKVIDKGIAKFENDGRFQHTKFLVLYCIYNQEKENRLPQELIANLEEMLHLIQSAKLKLNNIFISKNEILTNNINATLLNSEIHTQCLLYELTDVNLEELRKTHLFRLKEIFKDDDLYNKYPEFLHTQAFLEFLEYESEKDGMEKEKKRKSALSAIELGKIQSKKMPGFHDNIFLDLENRFAN
jgi:hypothetical protein